MTSRSGQRLEPVDFWRGIAIAGVVWIHCAYFLPHAPRLLDWVATVARFCVPVFILFWAYFAERSAQKPGWTPLDNLRRAMGLLVPFLFWSILYWLVRGDLGGGVVRQITKYWSGYGWSGQYFFVVILQLMVVFPLLRKASDLVSPRWNALLLVICIGLAELWLQPGEFLLKIGDRAAIYWIPYAICGIHLARGRSLARNLSWRWILPLLALAPFEAAWSASGIGRIGPYFLTSIAMASLVIGTTAIQGIRPGLGGWAPLRDFSSMLSRNSMGIFCVNPLPLVLSERFSLALPPSTFPGSGIVLPLASWGLALGFSLGLVVLLGKAGLGRVVQN